MDLNPDGFSKRNQNRVAFFLFLCGSYSVAFQAQRVLGKIQFFDIDSAIDQPQPFGARIYRLARRIKLHVALSQWRTEGEYLFFVFLIERCFDAVGVRRDLGEKEGQKEDDSFAIHGRDSLNRAAMNSVFFIWRSGFACAHAYGSEEEFSFSSLPGTYSSAREARLGNVTRLLRPVPLCGTGAR